MTQDACPVCHFTNVRLYLDDEDDGLDPASFGSSRTRLNHGRILRCADCGFGFRQVRSSPDELSEIYRKMDVGIYESETAGRMATAARHFGILRRFVASGERRLLDVGCASGCFLDEARKAGWSVAGVEPSETLHGKATEILGEGAALHCSTLERATLDPASFDVVTLWDVLEHIPEPEVFLRLCGSFLKPGGILLFTVPDLDSMEARLFGARWPLLLAEHLNYFNRGSLRLCGENAGLRLVHFGRRPVSFSLGYILFRLSQHKIPLTGFVLKWISPFAGKLLVPVYLGETVAVWSR